LRNGKAWILYKTSK